MNPIEFWYKALRDSIRFETDKMMQFLQKAGIYQYYTTAKDYIFVSVIDNLVEEIDMPMIKRLLMDYVIKNGDKKVKRAFERQINFPAGDKNMMLLDEVRIPFFRDTKKEAHFFFIDSIMVINKGAKDAKRIYYEDFHQPIWKSSIIERKCPVVIEWSEFATFIHNVFEDDDTRKLMKQSIGYLLHNHRDMAFTPAIILSDDNTSDDSQGGTGKGIIVQGISHYLKRTKEDGKNFDQAGYFLIKTLILIRGYFVLMMQGRIFHLKPCSVC